MFVAAWLCHESGAAAVVYAPQHQVILAQFTLSLGVPVFSIVHSQFRSPIIQHSSLSV